MRFFCFCATDPRRGLIEAVSQCACRGFMALVALDSFGAVGDAVKALGIQDGDLAGIHLDDAGILELGEHA